MFKYAIALSGGIATGKSTVASLFSLYGFLTIDADKIAHEILDNHTSTIADLFGEHYIQNNKVVRKELGKLIFSNKQAKEKLENFIHPLIKKEIILKSKVFEDQKKPYLIEIPLFFEKRNYDIKNSILVYAPRDIQLQRIVKRDNCTQTEAIEKLNNQLNIEDKKELATYIINNNKNLIFLQNEVERVKNLLL